MWRNGFTPLRARLMKKIEDAIQQKKFKSPHQKAVINLIYTANWLHSQHHCFFKRYGLTSHQFNILRVLKGQHPKSISATAIKSRMLDQNSDVSRLLDRLEKKHLIERRICPRDKRASDIFISTEGLQLLKEIDKKENSINGLLALTDEEATQLSDLLDRARGADSPGDR